MSVMKYINWIFGVIGWLMGFINGRNSVINAQNKEILKNVEMAKKVDEDIKNMSTSNIIDELRKSERN